MAKILVTYHTRGGSTKAMAEAVADAINEAGADATLKPVSEVDVAELVEFDGIVAGSPTYYGLMASELKKLFDDSVKLHGRLEGKVGGAFSSSANIGGGNETTIRSILDAMLIHGMIVQGAAHGDHYGPVAIGKPDARSLDQCRALGRRIVSLVRLVASS